MCSAPTGSSASIASLAPRSASGEMQSGAMRMLSYELGGEDQELDMQQAEACGAAQPMPRSSAEIAFNRPPAFIRSIVLPKR